MENRNLGQVSVPVVGLGTWRRLEAAAAAGRHRELISAAIAAGIALFDTSPMYGDAERLLPTRWTAGAARCSSPTRSGPRPRRKARRNWTARWPGTAARSTSCRSTTSSPGPRT